jgi:hypothetical protein
MEKISFGERKMIVGFKTIILGLLLYIVELLLLPVFGTLQKIQVNGQGFHSDFWKYTGEQPYPIILILTGIIILMGASLFSMGYKEMKIDN